MRKGRQPDARAASQPLFEPLALLLLSLATVGTAWCSFQAAAWGGVSQRTMSLSAAADRTAATAELQAYQLKLADVLLFTQYCNARDASNETLARFYSDRFRGEARTAFEAWLATQPFDRPDAPAHPFTPELYKLRLLEDARQQEAEGRRLWEAAGEAGQTSRNYVLLTVVLASALFCGGTASKFEALWIRRTVLTLGLAALVFAVGRVLLLPTQL